MTLGQCRGGRPCGRVKYVGWEITTPKTSPHLQRQPRSEPLPPAHQVAGLLLPFPAQQALSRADVCFPSGAWVPRQGSKHSQQKKETPFSLSQGIHKLSLLPSPMRAQVQCLPRGAGARWQSSQPGSCLCGHRLLCRLLEERGCVQPRLGSQSDDLSGSPAQLSPLALAPPKCGRGPGCTWSRRQTPPYQASFLPGAASALGERSDQPLSGSTGHKRLCALLSLWGQVGP